MQSLEDNTAAFRAFVETIGLQIFSEQEINHGHQCTVMDGASRVPINFYSTGRILVQGKDSPLKTKLTEWANLRQAGADQAQAKASQAGQVSHNSRYIVAPAKFQTIREEVIDQFSATITYRPTAQSAEVYRAEIVRGNERITVTQFQTGTLFVQGRSSQLFDDLCDALDQRLAQSFADRAARYLPIETAETTRLFLASADAENDAWNWVGKGLGQEVFDFLSVHDQQTIVSGAGILLALQETGRQLAEFSPVVMPFGKAFEGFVIRLAIHLGLVSEAAIQQSAESIKIGAWLGEIRERLPDQRRYEFVTASLNSAWQSRNKCMHADPEKPMPIRSLDEAQAEISSILRGIAKAHDVFLTQDRALREKVSVSQDEGNKKGKPSQFKEPEADTAKSTLPAQVERFENVDGERLAEQLIADELIVERQLQGSTTVWQAKSSNFEVFCSAKHPGRVTVRGLGAKDFATRYKTLLQPQTSLSLPNQEDELFPETTPSVVSGWIGVDESGKGDVFGPLVVAGVFVEATQVDSLLRLGVRDSKTLSESAIIRLSEQIKALCHHTMVRVVDPLEYNRLYEQISNLNHLLAQQHAEVITRLYEATKAPRAISDQFGDERLIRDELSARSCPINIEQRPHAEDDVAVAAASILARAAFVAWLRRASQSLGFVLPPGVAPATVESGQRLVESRGRKALAQYAKLHFRTVRDML